MHLCIIISILITKPCLYKASLPIVYHPNNPLRSRTLCAFSVPAKRVQHNSFRIIVIIIIPANNEGGPYLTSPHVPSRDFNLSTSHPFCPEFFFLSYASTPSFISPPGSIYSFMRCVFMKCVY